MAVVEVRLLGNMNDQLSQLTELHDREGNLLSLSIGSDLLEYSILSSAK